MQKESTLQDELKESKQRFSTTKKFIIGITSGLILLVVGSLGNITCNYFSGKDKIINEAGQVKVAVDTMQRKLNVVVGYMEHQKNCQWKQRILDSIRDTAISRQLSSLTMGQRAIYNKLNINIEYLKGMRTGYKQPYVSN